MPRRPASAAAPDVAYDGDPNTGFAVYDSLADQGYVGWQVVGGTSAGTPQWAALVAIADQGRALGGQATLDGASQTLPMLYSLYTATSATTTDAAAPPPPPTYAAAFNDIVGQRAAAAGSASGGAGSAVTTPTPPPPGYDAVTGLGTPKAAFVVDSLAGISRPSFGLRPVDRPRPTPTPTPTPGPPAHGSVRRHDLADRHVAAVPASPVSAVFTKYPRRQTSSAASPARSKLQLFNISSADFDGAVTINVYASTDSSVPSGDVAVGTLTLNVVSSSASASPRRSR